MNIKQLNEITTRLMAEGLADTEVMVDTATFPEMESGTVYEVNAAKIKSVEGADDAGPTGDKYAMLVISGEIEWHDHGTQPAPISGAKKE